jgi:predicted membrane protein
MWDPAYLVSQIDGFDNLTAITLLWASCGGVVHAVGYRPRSVLGQLFVFVPIIWLCLANILIRFNWG